MSEQIKECPYCGGEEQTYFDTWKSVQCACGAFGPTADNEEDAVLLWNAAANQIEAKDAEIEQLNGTIRMCDEEIEKLHKLIRVRRADIEKLRKERDEANQQVEYWHNGYIQSNKKWEDTYWKITEERNELEIQLGIKLDEARAWARKLHRANGLLIDNCITKFARINKITISYEPTDDAQP